ncbi:MAG TPA: hypothetical protein VHZ74_23185 [Bryobacteraceae bacterium]|jgi:hypothetical protein|nr:hypothetical protein [Bryobacteraceae bacterium]
MHRIAEFSSEEFVVSDEPAAYSVEGPAFAAIAWIPYYRSLSALPSNSEFLQHRGAHSRYGLPPAFWAMFYSGNPTDDWLSNPAARDIKSREQLLEFAQTRNYRGLLAVDSLRLWFSENSRLSKITFDLLWKIGYTRIPMANGYMQGGAPHGPAGSKHFALFNSDGGSQTLMIWLRYKMGRLADLGGFAMSGQWAPSAFLQIEYRFNGSIPHSVRFLGSHIPSLSMYVKWKGLKVHDMVGIRREQIDGFFNAGKCTDAPDDLLGTWEADFESEGAGGNWSI